MNNVSQNRLILLSREKDNNIIVELIDILYVYSMSYFGGISSMSPPHLGKKKKKWPNVLVF